MLMVYLLKITWNRIREIHHTLSVILTNVDSSRNIKKCTRILNSLLMALLLLFSAMLFPFAMFSFNFSGWMNAVPFALMLAAFYYIKKLVALIDGHSGYSEGYGAGISTAKF